MELRDQFMVKSGVKIHLAACDPADTAGFRNRAAVADKLSRNIARLEELQYVLYAEDKRSVLIVLQAMDAGGKDGTIRHVMTGVNPQGCRVTSFKVPTSEEAQHDFLWRIHHAVPPKGEIGIFNRSHYEDVLVARVHGLVGRAVWSKRYGQINAFEEILAGNNVVILKFYLHISKEEQKRRLEKRLKDPTRYWKASLSDLEDRKHWGDYMEAYEDALSRCSTEWAPWFVIPANRKWFRDFAVSQIIVETLEGMDMRFPPPTFDVSKVRIR